MVLGVSVWGKHPIPHPALRLAPSATALAGLLRVLKEQRVELVGSWASACAAANWWEVRLEMGRYPGWQPAEMEEPDLVQAKQPTIRWLAASCAKVGHFVHCTIQTDAADLRRHLSV